MNYQNKYLKYKSKYLKLKGGMLSMLSSLIKKTKETTDIKETIDKLKSINYTINIDDYLIDDELNKFLNKVIEDISLIYRKLSIASVDSTDV